MRFRTVEEATSFVRALAEAKGTGKRELLGAKMDSVPAWVSQDGKPIKHKLDGSEVEVVYLSYLQPTDKQKKQASPAKLAGVRLERISGRLIDVRSCKDGTTQVLFSNGLRDGGGLVAFRGPNIDKGILAYLSVNEGIGESIDEVIARIPQALIDQLKALKGKAPKRKKVAVEDPNQPVLIEVPAAEIRDSMKTGRTNPDEPDNTKPGRMKLK